MAKTSADLREERATIVAEARKTYDLAEARDGGVTEADKQAFDRAMDAGDKLKEDYTRLERYEAADRELNSPGERRSAPLETENGERREKADQSRDKAAKMAAYRHWMRTGEVREALRPEQRSAAENRDLTIDTEGAQGGSNLITPVQISDDIVKQMDAFVYVRQLCRAAGSITTVTRAQKLGIRQRLTRANAANWTTEIGPLTADSAMTFGRRDLEPQQLSKLALVSLRTLMLSTDAEGEVNGELAYQFGVTQEAGFLTGSGSGQPLGVYTASANGVPTSSDITASSTTTFSGDDLIALKYALRRPYRADPSAAWIVSTPFVKIARTLKVASAGQGDNLQYIWQPGLNNGDPDRILDIQYHESEYAPGVFTTGLYVAVLGCFRYYRIAELPAIAIQRLIELYAATGEVGFVGRMWLDGAPCLGEAFKRLKLQ